MKEYLILLGRVPELSLLELEAVFRRFNIEAYITKLTTNLAIVKTTADLDQGWFDRLGASIKLGLILLNTQDSMQLVDNLAVLIKTRLLGLSVLSRKLNGLDLAKKLKKRLGLKRYIVAERDQILSSAQSKGIRKKGQEFLIIEQNDNFYLVEIIAFQNIDDFTKRDRYLPVADPIRGMLPTKLARAMVNIAAGLVPNNDQLVIADPFCGTGRTLMEALLIGTEILGSDIDQKAVQATVDNLFWTVQQYRLKAQDFKQLIRVVDVGNIDSVFGDFAADLIVTEPYLGPPQRSNITDEEKEQIIKQISPLYLTLFRVGKNFLRYPGGIVVVFPVFGNISLLDKVIDKITSIGYHIQNKIRISRPDQFISREIAVFKVKS